MRSIQVARTLALLGMGTGCSTIVTPGTDAAPESAADAVLVQNDAVYTGDVCAARMQCNGVETTCSIVPGCESFSCNMTSLFCGCSASGCSCSCPGGPQLPPEYPEHFSASSLV